MIHELALHEYGDLQLLWTKLLKTLESRSISDEAVQQLLAFLRRVEPELDSCRKAEERGVLLVVLTEGYTFLQRFLGEEEKNRFKGLQAYFESFLSLDTEQKKQLLEQSLNAFRNLQAPSTKDYHRLGWALFRLRLLHGVNEPRDLLLREIWIVTEKLWNATAHTDLGARVEALDLQGWTVADTRLTLPFDEWWQHVERLATWLDELEAPIAADGSNFEKAVYYHWRAISSYHQYFAQVNSAGWQKARTHQIDAVEELRKALVEIEKTDDRKWRGVILGRLISKARPGGLGWATYSVLGERLEEVIQYLLSTKDDYLIGLGYIWVSTYLYRAAWLNGDLKTQQKILINSKDHLVKATEIFQQLYGTERVVYPYRRLSFIFSFLLEQEADPDRRNELGETASRYADLALKAALASESEPLKITACSAIVNVRRLTARFTKQPEQERHRLFETIKLVQEFVTLANQTGQTNAYGYLLVDLGSLLTALGEMESDPVVLKQADEYFSEAIQIFEVQQEKNILGRLYAASARILALSGAHSQATDRYRKAHRILKAQNPSRAGYYKLWASISRAKELHISGDLHEASREIKLGLKAVMEFNEWALDVRFWEALSILEYAEYLIKQERIQLATAWFEKAMRAMRFFLHDTKSHQSTSYLRFLQSRADFVCNYIELRANMSKGRLLSKRGKHRYALKRYEAALDNIETLKKMGAEKAIPDLIAYLEGITKLRRHVEGAYYSHDVSELEAARIFIRQNSGLFPPNIEPALATIGRILELFMACINLFQIHPVKITLKQTDELQIRYQQLADEIEKANLAPIAQHLRIISQLLKAAILATKANRLSKYPSSDRLSLRVSETLSEAYQAAKGIHNQMILHRISINHKQALTAVREHTSFELPIWDLILEFPIIDIIQISLAYDFRMEHPEDPIPILEQREYSEQIIEDKVIRFHTPEAKMIFDYLNESFIEDLRFQRPSGVRGYRSLPEIMSRCRLAPTQIYGKYDKTGDASELIRLGWPQDRAVPGPSLRELLENGLIVIQVFQGQRGRKGNPIRIRAATEKVPVQLYINKKYEKIL